MRGLPFRCSPAKSVFLVRQCLSFCGGQQITPDGILVIDNHLLKSGILHKPYQRHLAKGMTKTKALIAIARKLIGIIFALVRDHSDYIADYSGQLVFKKAA
jgi:hypothetical protein